MEKKIRETRKKNEITEYCAVSDFSRDTKHCDSITLDGVNKKK